MFTASSPAAQLDPCSPPARLATHSQTPLDLEVSTLHLPPAYGPVPILDYPHQTHFSHLLLPASPALWQHKSKGGTSTHCCLALTPVSSRLWGSWGADQAAEQRLSPCGIQVSWGSGESRFSRHPKTGKVSPPSGCLPLASALQWVPHVLPLNQVTGRLPVQGKAGHASWRPARWQP